MYLMGFHPPNVAYLNKGYGGESKYRGGEEILVTRNNVYDAYYVYHP